MCHMFGKYECFDYWKWPFFNLKKKKDKKIKKISKRVWSLSSLLQTRPIWKALSVSYFLKKILSSSKKTRFCRTFRNGLWIFLNCSIFFCFVFSAPKQGFETIALWKELPLSFQSPPSLFSLVLLGIGKWVSSLSLCNQCTYCGFHLGFVFISWYYSFLFLGFFWVILCFMISFQDFVWFLREMRKSWEKERKFGVLCFMVFWFEM